ncbi:unnamed protein product [Moneuplotes crassus]|uniref:Casein kinase I n=2 Tax=Euplotes crassus TaxID=5936 RepID=A0AAD1X9G1_EUPCR|nr:unnamed protein product [Moneuplotes crassus]
MKLKIGQRIGKGGQSEVFEAFDDSYNQYAVKVFFDEGPFENEVEVMEAIEKIESPNLSKLIATSKFEDGSNGIVMPLLGKNFRVCIKASEDRNSTSLKYATQMIDAVESLHKCGYIHCDIKSENFVVSPDMKTIILIDYGLCHRFKEREAIYQIFTQKNNLNINIEMDGLNEGGFENRRTIPKHFKGTLTYASLSCMDGKVHSYRDDLESLAYVLLYAKLGSLPWQKHRKIADTDEKRKKIYQEKLNFLNDFRAEDYKEDLSNVVKFLKYATSLDETEVPDYNYCRELFTRELELLDAPLKYKKDLFEFMRCSDISYSKRPSITCIKDNQSFNAIPFTGFKTKVISIKESDENSSKKGDDESKIEEIIMTKKTTLQLQQNRNSDRIVRPKMSNASSRDFHDSTLPTKTQSAYKKHQDRNRITSSPGLDFHANLNLGSAEDLLGSEVLKKINVPPKVNPRLRVIKEEELKYTNSFAFTPKEESIKNIDYECNDIKVSLPNHDSPKKKEEVKSASSHCEDLKSIELTEFYQYSTPQGKYCLVSCRLCFC